MKTKLEYITYIHLEGTLEDAINQLKNEVDEAVKRGFDSTTLRFESFGNQPALCRKVETEAERLAREAKEEQARQKKLQRLKKDAEQLGYKLVEEQK